MTGKVHSENQADMLTPQVAKNVSNMSYLEPSSSLYDFGHHNHYLGRSQQ